MVVDHGFRVESLCVVLLLACHWLLSEVEHSYVQDARWYIGVEFRWLACMPIRLHGLLAGLLACLLAYCFACLLGLVSEVVSLLSAGDATSNWDVSMLGPCVGRVVPPESVDR